MLSERKRQCTHLGDQQRQMKKNDVAAGSMDLAVVLGLEVGAVARM